MSGAGVVGARNGRRVWLHDDFRNSLYGVVTSDSVTWITMTLDSGAKICLDLDDLWDVKVMDEPPNEGGADEGTTDQGCPGGETAADVRAGADSREVGAVVSEALPASEEGGVGQPSAGAPPMPLPHRDERGITTGNCLYPRLLRRVAALCEALNALEDEDVERRESAYYAHVPGHAIGIYTEETGDEANPHANLEGWVVQEDAHSWVFIARKHSWAEGAPSDAIEAAR